MDEIFEETEPLDDGSPGMPAPALPEDIEKRVTPRRTRRYVLLALALAVAVGAPGYFLVSRLVTKPRAVAADAVNAGLAAHRAGKLQEATAFYREALRHDPQNKYAHYNLGLIAQTTGDRSTAEREYRITLAIDDRFTGAIFNLAIIRTEAGALGEARDLYRRVIQIEPRNAGAHLNLGFVLLKLSATAEAKAAFAEAVRLDPKTADRVPAEAR